METAIELFLADGKPSGIFYCSECRAVFNVRATAQRCHGVTHCDNCGVELGKRQPHYRTTCEACDSAAWREKQTKEEFERYQKATKISSGDWNGDQVFFGDQYYDSLEDAIDQCEQPPEYVWAAKNTGVPKATSQDLYELVVEGMWEDADFNDLNGTEELEAALASFNAANESITVWMVDYSTAIVLDESVLAEWRAESAGKSPALPEGSAEEKV